MKKEITCSIVSVLIAIVSVFSITSIAMFPASATTSWPSLSQSSYCEFTAAGTIPVYRNSNCSTRGTVSPAKNYNAYIDPGDVCRIYSITSSYVLLAYPTSSGMRTGYVSRSAIFRVSAPSARESSRGTVYTYTTAGGRSYGYVESGDSVWNCGTSGSYTAVIYTAQSGNRAYKYGFVNTSSYNTTIRSAGSSSALPAPRVYYTKRSNTCVCLYWSAVSGASGYVVYYSFNNSNYYRQTTTTNRAVALNYKGNGTLYFMVKAYRGSTYGAAGYSGGVSFSTSSYDADAAVRYAREHWNDGKGLCAEFTSDCVARGGVYIPNQSCYSSSTAALTGIALGAYTNPYTCSEAQLKWFSDQGYTVLQYPSNDQISVGDLAWCGGSGRYADNHVVIITGFNSSGYPLYCAHNNAHCDAVLYSVPYVVKMASR